MDVGRSAGGDTSDDALHGANRVNFVTFDSLAMRLSGTLH
jgi:hypothetical protein